jgi:hypothetical protein
MTTRSFKAFIYVFLLLFAQQVALTHAAWHAREHTPAHQTGKGDASLQGDLCGLHGAFSQVLGGAQTGAVQLAIPLGVADAIPPYSGLYVALRLHAPLSRGPPVFS